MRFIRIEQADASTPLYKERDNGTTRPVAEDDPSYLEWLAGGGQVETLPYVAPDPAVVLAAAKADMVERIKEATNKYCAAGWGYPKYAAALVEVYPYTESTKADINAFFTDVLFCQAESINQVNACVSVEELAALITDLEAEYAGYI